MVEKTFSKSKQGVKTVKLYAEGPNNAFSLLKFRGIGDEGD